MAKSPYSRYSTHWQVAQTPQSEPVPGKTMARNEAGGFVFEVSDWDRLLRFLIIGTEGGTYYVSEHDLTIQNAEVLLRCLVADGLRVVREIAAVSDSGRAVKNEPALFALAVCAGMGDASARRAALDALPMVARTGTHLFHFLQHVQGFRGWGRGLRRAVGNWYLNQPLAHVAYEMVKYRQRDGWAQADALRLSHPKTADVERNLLFKWACDGWQSEWASDSFRGDLRIVEGWEKLQHAADAREAATLIRAYNLSREAVPTEHLDSKLVWEALLERMPYTALLRNLNKLMALGILAPMGAWTAKVAGWLTDAARIRSARIHPCALLIAQHAYWSGAGLLGDLKWEPVPAITDALEAAFYASFGCLEPTGKRIVVGVDCSGSMESNSVMSGGSRGTRHAVMPVKEAAAAMAMTIVRSEPNHVMVCFDTMPWVVVAGPQHSLAEVTAKLHVGQGGGTDCAQPILWAIANKVEADAFVILTDEETWAGKIHPCQAAQTYRKRFVMPARLVSMAMAAYGTDIADPDDLLSLGIVGFDASAPLAAREFIRGGEASDASTPV